MSCSYNRRFLSFIEYKAIDNLDKPIYNIVLRMGLFVAQVIHWQKACVWKMAPRNKKLTRTHLYTQPIYKICPINKLKNYGKNTKDPMSVYMWVNENKESMFYCNDYGIWDWFPCLMGTCHSQLESKLSGKCKW